MSESTAAADPSLVPTGRDWRKSGSGTGGEFAFGPYAVKWSRSVPVNARTPVPAEFAVRAHDGESSCEIEVAMPRTTELAQGIELVVDDEHVRVQRNGPRLFRRQRAIRCTGAGIDWVFSGRWIGHPPLLDGARTIWTPLRGGKVAPDLPSRHAAVVVALVASGVPETTSIANALTYL